MQNNMLKEDILFNIQKTFLVEYKKSVKQKYF